MPAYLEIWGGSGPQLRPLDTDRVTVGKAEANDVTLGSDGTVSRLHAVFERYAAGWCVRDMGSTNGTFVNGERIWAEVPLRHGDEVKLGAARLVFRADEAAGADATVATDAPPELTRRERDVLVALCRPVLSGDVFTEPASTQQVADALVVSEAAVKQHLARLYDKFAIYETERRRVRLANEAIRRGAVSLTDLREQA